jgi:hypothetical protein
MGEVKSGMSPGRRPRAGRGGGTGPRRRGRRLRAALSLRVAPAPGSSRSGPPNRPRPPRRPRPRRNRDGRPTQCSSPALLPRRRPEGNRWANDTDGFVLAAKPGGSQGRPPKSRARSPSRKNGQPSLRSPENPRSRSAEPTPGDGQQPQSDSFMPRIPQATAARGRRLLLVRSDSSSAGAKARPFIGGQHRRWRRRARVAARRQVRASRCLMLGVETPCERSREVPQVILRSGVDADEAVSITMDRDVVSKASTPTKKCAPANRCGVNLPPAASKPSRSSAVGSGRGMTAPITIAAPPRLLSWRTSMSLRPALANSSPRRSDSPAGGGP